MNTNSDMLAQDARTWRAIRLGDEPPISEDTRKKGPREVVAAALAQLRRAAPPAESAR
jgi:hypothetical protein